ncbi:MAG: hypothetical protein ACYCVZ_04295 [Streptosporangiaceae bacterium]
MYSIKRAAARLSARLRTTASAKPTSAPAPLPAPSEPETVRATPETAGTPRLIKPRPGPWLEIATQPGTFLIASRDSVSGKPDPATRAFIGSIDGLELGSTFDSRHASNGMPCGEWTVRALVRNQKVSGSLPARRNIQVNQIITR